MFVFVLVGSEPGLEVDVLDVEEVVVGAEGMSGDVRTEVEFVGTP